MHRIVRLGCDPGTPKSQIQPPKTLILVVPKTNDYETYIKARSATRVPMNEQGGRVGDSERKEVTNGQDTVSVFSERPS